MKLPRVKKLYSTENEKFEINKAKEDRKITKI